MLLLSLLTVHTNKANMWCNLKVTGKSFSEAFILASVNPQYDKRLFIEFKEKYKVTTCCLQILFWMSKQKQKNNLCTRLVVYLHFSWNSMNNILSYCGLTDSRMRASDTDLPVFKSASTYCGKESWEKNGTCLQKFYISWKTKFYNVYRKVKIGVVPST